MTAEDRNRLWGAILYPDSLPDGWLEMIERMHVPIAISPLHDRDVWTEFDERENPVHKAGELKKPHYHMIMYFSGPKSLRQVVSLLEPLGKGLLGNPISLADKLASNRYLIHLDNPDKAQYDPKDIVCLSGAVCELEKRLTQNEQQAVYDRVEGLIDDMSITEYQELLKYLRGEGLTLEAMFVRQHTIHFNAYLRSARFSVQKEG